MAVLFDSNVDDIAFAVEAPIQELITARAFAMSGSNKPVCKLFLAHRCEKGDRCHFRHARNDRTVVCKHWLRGLCKKDDSCEFLHEYDLNRMPICHFFTTYGVCSNEDCPFLHVKAEDRQKMCSWFARGFCKNGPNCPRRHLKLQACPDYLAGFCIKGPACTLGHPKFEVTTDNGTNLPRSVVCARCGNSGHIAANCPEAVSVPGGPAPYGGGGGEFGQVRLVLSTWYTVQSM